MRGRTSVLVLPIALAVAPAMLAQASFVLPTFADLTIKRRHTFGSASSTEVMYLKGARERWDVRADPPGHTGSRYVTILQCDQRRSVQLNPDAKLYAVSVLQLVELSENPLDPSLFDIPVDYRPALPLVRGGYDMTRPDSLSSRLEMYWNELRLTARAIFR